METVKLEFGILETGKLENEISIKIIFSNPNIICEKDNFCNKF